MKCHSGSNWAAKIHNLAKFELRGPFVSQVTMGWGVFALQYLYLHLYLHPYIPMCICMLAYLV